MVLLQLQQVLPFLGAAVLVTISPGPDNLAVLSMGVSRGRRQGMAFGFGCAAGCLSHTSLAAAGVSALIAASRPAFLALKIVGGLYLLWLGVKALRSKGHAVNAKAVSSADGVGKAFAQGVLANAVNPKVVLFFLAFLPQFVTASRGGIPAQMIQLGVLFTLQAAVLFGLLGYSSGHVGAWLGRHRSAPKWLDRIAGGVFSSLGLRLILGR